MAICDNTVRTRGKVFVIFRSDGQGRYGCETKGPGSLDGQAQEGEIRYALSKGCTISWIDSTTAATSSRVMSQLESGKPGTILGMRFAARLTLAALVLGGASVVMLKIMRTSRALYREWLIFSGRAVFRDGRFMMK